MSIETRVKKQLRLTKPQFFALKGIDMLCRSGGVDMATLRANGNRLDVVIRLCKLGLAFAAGDYGDRDNVRFDLTDAGHRYLAGTGGAA